MIGRWHLDPAGDGWVLHYTDAHEEEEEPVTNPGGFSGFADEEGDVPTEWEQTSGGDEDGEEADGGDEG